MHLSYSFTCPCGMKYNCLRDFGNSLEPQEQHDTIREYRHEVATCIECNKKFQAHVVGSGSGLKVNIDGATNVSFRRINNTSEWGTTDVFEFLRHIDSEDYEELRWVIKSTEQRENFDRVMYDVNALLLADIAIPNMSTLYNMMHAQVVTAVEAYLSSAFIHKVVNSPELIRKLVETDPFFKEQKLSLSEIFQKYNDLKLVVVKYLQDLIFHNLRKIKPMYKSVLGVDLGEINWLCKAVILRHDCVHRNGVDKDEKPTGIGKEQISDLIEKCSSLIMRIDLEIAKTEA